MHTDESKPWITMLKLFEAGSIKDLENFINSLSSRDVLYAFSHLSILEQEKLLAALAPKDAADLIEELPDTQALELIERMDPSRAASIVDELPSTEQADILGEMEWDDAEAILVQMDPQEAAEARKLVKYPEDVAGGLMATEYLAYLEELRVLDVIEDLKRNSKKYADYNVQYIYIVNKSQKLVGILRIRDLLLSATDRVLQSFMIKDPISTLESTGLEDLADLFHHYNYFGIPVVDCDKRLVGVVRRSAVREVLTERADADHMKSQGIISGDELRSMSLFSRSKGRLSWLSLNVILNIMAASIIAMYQDTLSAAITLAVFLPIISDMSGCSGNQAVAVSMRELSLGVIRPTEVFWVWRKEIILGLISGVILGCLLALAAWLWQGNPYLGLVVGIAMALNTLIAVSIGGSVPLILKGIGKDPALASGPILTTVTDMCGFFILLSLATLLLPKLI